LHTPPNPPLTLHSWRPSKFPSKRGPHHPPLSPLLSLSVRFASPAVAPAAASSSGALLPPRRTANQAKPRVASLLRGSARGLDGRMAMDWGGCRRPWRVPTSLPPAQHNTTQHGSFRTTWRTRSSKQRKKSRR
jgi:hypothetical protein